MSSLAHQLVDAVCEFLEAAVHTTLWARSLYSTELFERQKLYGIIIRKCRHPEVCSYIASVLSNLKGLNASDASIDIASLTSSFTSALLKLQFIDNLLRPLPPGATFELVAFTISRKAVNSQFFAEENIDEVQLSQPVSAFPLKTIKVGTAVNMQILLEESEHLKQ
eukprot:jgi/Chrzof1/13868/Cz08g15180.t1